MRTTLQDLLTSEDVIIADGGMGTMLFSLGLQYGDSPELWNVEQPDRVRSVHRGYIEAGAQIILTNTFGCNRLRLDLHDLSDRATELNQAAATLARAEADAASHPVAVGGSMGPTGSILQPYGELEFEQAVDIFAEQGRALVDGDVDVLWIETMSDLGEVSAAIEGCRRVAPDFPLVSTMTFDTRGCTMMGVTPEQALHTLRAHNVLALGGNCGNGTDEIEGVIQKMEAANDDVPLIAKANVGLPRLEKGVAVYDTPPEAMAEYAVNVHHLGAKIVGACCGSTPDHIRAIAGALTGAGG